MGALPMLPYKFSLNKPFLIFFAASPFIRHSGRSERERAKWPESVAVFAEKCQKLTSYFVIPVLREAQRPGSSAQEARMQSQVARSSALLLIVKGNVCGASTKAIEDPGLPAYGGKPG